MIGNGPTYKNHKLRRNHTNYRIGGFYMKKNIGALCGIGFGLLTVGVGVGILISKKAKGGLK